jgi:hypothetical protein
MKRTVQWIVYLNITCMVFPVLATTRHVATNSYTYTGEFVSLKDSTSGTLPSVRNRQFFIKNSGQYDAQVKYVVRGVKGSVFFTPKEVVFDFVRTKAIQPPADKTDNDSEKMPEMERLVFRMAFDSGNTNVVMVGQKELPGKINYLIGSQAEWKYGISTFEEVLYKNIYDGIDICFMLPQNNLRYVIYLDNDTDLDKFRLTYTGVKGLNVNDDGSLIIHTELGDFIESPPVVWLGDNMLNVRFLVSGTNQVGVALIKVLSNKTRKGSM